MEIKLHKLRSEPEIFTPIEFHSGVNLILGEKVPDAGVKKGKKTNGVGKSLCIEFINFCLLKEASSSRVMKIPLDKFDEGTKIILELEINGQNICISRSKAKPNAPLIIKDGETLTFDNLNDANKYLENLLFQNEPLDEKISFRDFLGPFIREEESEFKDILHCYDLTKNIPASIKPHAYLFQIKTDLIDRIKGQYKKIDSSNELKKEFFRRLKEKGFQKVSEIKKVLNSLNDDLAKIDDSLDKLQTDEAFEIKEADLIRYQESIDELRTRRTALMYELRRIESLPQLEVIDVKEVEMIYNQFKSGLGEIVSRSLTEIIHFKQKIDDFQRKLFNIKKTSIEEELEKVNEALSKIEGERSKSLTSLNKSGVFKDVKSGYAIYEEKKNEHKDIQTNYDNYEHYEKLWKQLKHENDSYFLDLDEQIEASKKIIESFNQTILKIHEYIMDSNVTSFEIKTKNTATSKQILTFEMRIDDDGGHSVDRTKVFIYDMALLLNEYTHLRHPKLLIHDNIFDVDQDTLLKSLNYLSLQESSKFQYILTLNRDKIENEEKEKTLELQISEHRIAYFTKQNRFLHGDKYAEV